MELSQEQRRALALDRPICLSAGAGSGKTRVLIERYLLALEDVGFDPDAVLAVTFTRKAAAEVLGRVREAIGERIVKGGESSARWRQVRERLPDAWIMTIDAFCHRVLSSMGPASGLPADRRILVGGGLAEITHEAVRQVIDHVADTAEDPDRESLRLLLHALGRDGLVAQLQMLIERRARAIPWAEDVLAGRAVDPARALSILSRLEGQATPAAGANDAEQQALTGALARIFDRMLAKYRALLRAADACDFRHLLEDVAAAFRDERVRRHWAARFRHVLVDEFQDTDPLQWEVLKSLFGATRIERPGLFVVGDEKQAIFSFRDGDVVTFREAASEISRSGGREETLADNYRSTPKLVAFCNSLSRSLFEGTTLDFEARHAPMEAARARKPERLTAPGSPGPFDSRIEILVARGENGAEARERELQAIASRIRRFVDEKTEVFAALDGGGKGVRAAKLSDQAILLRARRILPELEAVLTEHRIPFRVLGGVGFFGCHEVRMLMNLMRFLADERDELALLGTLRSPLFGIADSVLLKAVARARPERGGLWRKVTDLAAAVRSGADQTPTPADGPVLVDAVARLSRYRALADQLAANELVALAVRESDIMLTLGVADPSGRAAANVEKLLDMVRNLQAQGVAALDEIERTLSMTDRETDSPEAQADPPATSDAVSILTVHAAKGLEWPIVFLPNAASDVTQTARDTPVPLQVRVDGRRVLIHSVRSKELPSGAAKNRVHDAVGRMSRREQVAEAKRLLYVAATRARDHLVVSASLGRADVPEHSWLAWLQIAGETGARTFDPAPVAAPPERRDHVLFTEEPRFAELPGPAAAPASPPVAFTVPATALSTLHACPRRFFLERVLGLPSEDPRARGAGGPSDEIDPTVRGAIVHAALEGIATGVDPLSRVAGLAIQAGVSGESAVAALEDHVRNAVAKLKEWPIGRRILDAPRGRVRTEVPFELGSGACRVVGTIDLVFEPEDGGAVIVDFKTDRNVPKSPEGARKLAQDSGYVDQVSAYAAAARRRSSGPVSAWLFFTQSGLPLPVVGEPGLESAEDCARIVDDGLDRAAKSAAAGFPLTDDARICGECPHRAGACPGAG